VVSALNISKITEKSLFHVGPRWARSTERILIGCTRSMTVVHVSEVFLRSQVRGYSLNLLGEVDGCCVAAANDNGDALARRRAVTLREQGREGCRPSRLGDNAQHRP
jgi:hypothetical protein